jgi:hypothetical protein
MTPPKITKGGPRPNRKDYKTDKQFMSAVKKWNELNGFAGTSPTPAPTPNISTKVIDTKNVDPNTTSGTGSVRTDWESFTNGKINLQRGDSTIGQAPYVTAIVPKYGEGKPTPIVIMPASDGNGFSLEPREVFLEKLITQIERSPDNVRYWKSQLRDFYKSDDAFARSLRGGPVTDKDTDFIEALKKALDEITTNNFNFGAENFNSGNLTSRNFYDVNNWITSRTPVPGRQTTSTSTKNFTLQADAIADFMREVQIQVGDPALVDNVKELANAYWEKVHNEELKRMGRSTSVTDPITNTTIYTGTGFQAPTEELLKEWRVKFIANGATSKTKVISTGIKNVNPLDLQDAGGEMGDAYTKLKGYSLDYGVKLSDSQLKEKTAEALLPGGSIDEQRKSIMMASRATYKSLAPYIEGGLKVKDIGSQYLKMKIDELELPEGSIDIFDPDVQAALSGDKLMSPTDFTMLNRANPAWRTTRKANESAANFVNTILKMWGKVG